MIETRKKRKNRKKADTKNYVINTRGIQTTPVVYTLLVRLIVPATAKSFTMVHATQTW